MSRCARSALGRCCAIAAALAVTLAVGASPASASGVLNSQCNVSTGGFVPFYSGNNPAQTFRASSPGPLLKVDLENISRAEKGIGGDITIQVYGTDEAGTPVEPVLATTKFLSEHVTADAYYHEYSAEFDPSTAAYLTSGKLYGLAISTTDTAQNVWEFAENDPCAEVALFAGGPPFGPVLGTYTTFDAGLRTYMGPPNDNFEHPTVLSGQDTSSEGTTAGASRQEPQEPDHYVTDPPDSDSWIGDHSVWYRWTAPNSGKTSIDTCTGKIDSILAVYTGEELGSLTRIGDNNNDPACTADVYGSKLTFEAVAGTTYDIAVGDAGGARENTFTLNIVGAADTTPPDTEIDSGPSGATAEASPAFAFSSEPGATFQCRLDSGQESAFQPCTSPKAYSSLPPGPHTFEVRAVDAAENVDPTPASRSFTVEAQHQEERQASLPDSFIGKVKINRTKRSAKFRFSSSEPGATFLCKLDGKPFRPCTSPKTYRHLKPGRHRFQVEADSLAGLDPTPAFRPFRIKP